MADLLQYDTYDAVHAVRFRKTNEPPYGGLSNMAAGFSFQIAGIPIRTAEALYQACRFPHQPATQRFLIGLASPKAVKIEVGPRKSMTRPDWATARFDIMRWVLRVKLCQNWDKFSKLLLRTGTSAIVEESYKDTVWTARLSPSGKRLHGRNVLGKLLVELRSELQTRERAELESVRPLSLLDFRLDGKQIGVILPFLKDDLQEQQSQLPLQNPA